MMEWEPKEYQQGRGGSGTGGHTAHSRVLSDHEGLTFWGPPGTGEGHSHVCEPPLLQQAHFEYNQTSQKPHLGQKLTSGQTLTIILK